MSAFEGYVNALRFFAWRAIECTPMSMYYLYQVSKCRAISNNHSVILGADHCIVVI